MRYHNARRFEAVQKERYSVRNHIDVRQILFLLQLQQIIQIVVTIDFLLFAQFDGVLHQLYEKGFDAFRNEWHLVDFLNKRKRLDQQKVDDQFYIRFEYRRAHLTDD